MEDLQLVFLVLGGIAILAVLIHGVWSIRRQQTNTIKGKKQPHKKSSVRHGRDSDGFDSDGISAVRVRSTPRAQTEAQAKHSIEEPSVELNTNAETSSRVEPALGAVVLEESVAKQTASVIEPTQAGLFDSQEFDDQELDSQWFDNKELNDYKVAEQPLSQSQPSVETQQETAVEQPNEAEEELPDPYDVLVLHVMGKNGEMLKGAELLPSMLSMNFKFGDMDIFHRHQEPSGAGKVLFSIANMVNPGVFNPDNMEQFSTQGVVMFMRLPCHGKALNNFSIMLNSAMQMADDLGGAVMDGQREPWDEAKKQDYIRRIKS
ncbi:MAG: cell division protein ZipA [Shewanella sp.]|nr:cell division protein ZipA [Shewanella sp.]